MIPGYTYERLQRLYDAAAARNQKIFYATQYVKRREFKKRRKRGPNGKYILNDDGSYIMEDGAGPFVVYQKVNGKRVPVYDILKGPNKKPRKKQYPMTSVKRMLDGTKNMLDFWTHNKKVVRELILMFLKKDISQ